MFFLFDVQPHSKSRLSFSHRPGGTGIWTEGEFEDGSRIEYGVGFLERNSREPLGYCMAIDYDRVTINSPQENGYEYRGNWDNLNVTAVTDCAP